MQARVIDSIIKRITRLFLIASLASAMFYLIGVLQNNSFEHSYLMWNLGLAWIPLGLSVLLHRLLRTRSWTSWLLMGLTALWLGFLPNTFYMITDYMHLHDVTRADEMLDIVMFTLAIATSTALGFASIMLVHHELRKRLPPETCWRIVLFIIFLASLAIYVGRHLRWNTWDIITNPAGILFDMSERIINPTAHPQTYFTTLSFFALLSLGYYIVWQVAAILRNPSR